MLRRRRARESLIDYARYTNRAYRPAGHHFLIADGLERVERGEVKRLMVFMPPRHGKSELGSRRFPAWFMGRRPAMSTIAASYNSDLANDFGRDVRNIMASPEHARLFPRSLLAQDSQAQNRWHTQAGGSYVAAGVGTATTGRGAHVFLIDDPVKDRESADSELIRQKTYSWYLSTAYTRLEGVLTEQDSDPLWRDIDEAMEKGEPFEGAVVLIQTRWHEDDLAGRLLADMARGADQWEIIDLPAISDAGEPLWPEKYSLERLNRIKTQLSSREWNALYQQTPVADQGDYFRREWFASRHEGHDKPLPGYRYFITTDFAVTADGGDATEFAVWAMDSEGMASEVAWWSGRETALVWIEALIDLMEIWKPRAMFGETGVIRRAIEPLLRRRMRERKVMCRLEWLTRSGDKAAMARPFQGRAEMGLVRFSRSKDADAVIDQLIAFPAGQNDDKVDTCALLGMALDQAHPAIVSKDDAAKDDNRSRPTDWDRTRDDVENWRTA